MVKRGEILREHILWSAKDVLLESGYDRVSMDLVASRAGTTKRSVYAHFANKEHLFLSVLDLVRATFRLRLLAPQDYSDDPADALTLFCARYLEILLYEGSIALCRVSMGESGRFPAQAAKCFAMLFADVGELLRAYLAERLDLTAAEAMRAAEKLLGDVVHARFMRVLFRIDPALGRFDDDRLSPDMDLAPIRSAVADLLRSVPAPT